MLRAAQYKKDGQKLVQLIRNMRSSSSSSTPADTWFIWDCLVRNWGVTEQVLREIPDYGTISAYSNPADAWIKGLSIYSGNIRPEIRQQIIDILMPHQQHHGLCRSLLGIVLMHPHESTERRKQGAMYLTDPEAPPHAEYLLGMALRQSNSFEHQRLGFEFMKRAARMLHPRAMSVVAVYCHEHTDPEQLRLLTTAASTYEELYACYTLGSIRNDASYCRRAYIGGLDQGLEVLTCMPAERAIPWGQWCADPLMHRFVPLEMHLAIRMVLLMHMRKGVLFGRLPKHVILSICFWICTAGTFGTKVH
jgi:hypothetical protein